MSLKIAVGYARTSGLINPKTSIPNQIHDIKKYCKEHQIYLRGIYVDECKTGTKVEGRDQYAQMKNVLEQENINMVIVSNFDRFSRNSLEFTQTITSLKQQNISVHSISQSSNTMNMSAMEIAMAGVQPEMENNMRSERLKSGRKQERKKGKFSSRTLPFGYDLDEQRHLIINPDKAKIVKESFKLFLLEKNYNKTLRRLKSKYPLFPIKTGSNLKSMLKKPVYTGKDCVLNDDNPNNLHVETVSNRSHTPIISETLFWKVIACMQEITSKRKTKEKFKREIYLLSKVAICYRCKEFFEGRKGKYKCACKTTMQKESVDKQWLKRMEKLKNSKEASISMMQKNWLLEKMESNLLRFATCKINTITFEKNKRRINDEMLALYYQSEEDNKLYAIQHVIKLFKDKNSREFKKMAKKINLSFQFDPVNEKFHIEENLA